MFLNIDFLAGTLTGLFLIPPIVRRIAAGSGDSRAIMNQRVYEAVRSFIRTEAVLHGEDIRGLCVETTAALLTHAAGAATACGLERQWFVLESGVAYDGVVRRVREAKEEKDGVQP